jgi:PAS domain S-box-containing protein
MTSMTPSEHRPDHDNANTSDARLIWDVLPELLAIMDVDGRFQNINPAWTGLLGWSESDLLGQNAETLIHPEDREQARAHLRSLVADQSPLSFEARLRDSSGGYSPFSWMAVTEQGRIFISARDLTHAKRTEHALRVSRQEIGQAERQTTMSEMTASIAHELNQPLSAIVTSAQAALRWLARAEPNLAEIRNALTRIVDDGRRSGEIISSIRAMFGKDRREKQALKANDLICDVLALVKDQLTSQSVALQLELSDGVPEISADRIQLQQVLLNLFNNALDAMSAVPQRRLLSVKSQVLDPSHILILVEDTGTGIDSKHADRVFDAFFTTKAHGMGMGLAICRSIVETHGGRLWASPASTHGTSFYLTLPIAGAKTEGPVFTHADAA